MSKRNKNVTAESFVANDSSVFQLGNFSAKYIKSSTAKRDNTNSELDPDVIEDAESVQPLTISGGFNKIPLTEIDDSTQLGVSLHKSGSNYDTNRKESLLSSSLSQSFASSRLQKNNSNKQLHPNMNQLWDGYNSPHESPSAMSQLRQQPPPPPPVQTITGSSIEPAGTNYSSLKTPGGFITREIEPWVNDKKQESFHHTGLQPLRRVTSSGSINTKSRRSTMNIGSEADALGTTNVSVRELVAPGAFRRNFIFSKKSNSDFKNSNIVTKNFMEFLDLYGHFAGQDLRDDETEYEYTEGEESRIGYNENVIEDEENDRLRGIYKRNNRTEINQKFKSSNKKTSTLKAFLLLLKAFLGTGIIFLPKAFSNGGLLFSNLMIVSFSLISYYCFIILIKTTSKCKVSGYGDLGYKLYGKKIQFIILLSLALSQLGFASTYVVFVSKNFQQILDIVYNNYYSLGLFILIQGIIFLPISLNRNISKLGFFALIADVFIFLGLVYIYFQSSLKFINDGASNKVELFKPESWTLFIGTAVFTYEGIGLLIPIQESMREPEKFNKLLLLVMIIVTIVFTTIASLSYLSFGDDIHTIILMDFPMTKLTTTIQFLYSIAILLSTPIQLFPAIKIIEGYLFHQNRKPWKDKIRRNSEAISVLSNNTNGFSAINGEEFSPLFATVSSNNSYDIIPNVNLINEEGLVSGKSDGFIKVLKNVVRVLIVVLMCTIGWCGSDKLDKFVSLIGSMTCVPLIYIYPPLLYTKGFQNQLSWGDRTTCGGVLVIGLILLAYTSYETMSHW
jgi:proton-coupled amino acid transporter